MMIATVAAITTILASSPNPKLFVVQHSPYTDEARWAREMALIKELRFGGVRAGWGTGVVVAKEGRSLSQWGQKLVRDSLDRYKAAGLKVHLTLDSSLSNGASEEVGWNANRFVIDEAIKRFAPEDLSFSMANEPQAFSQRKTDSRLTTHAQRVMSYHRDNSKFSKYTLYSPTIHGWLTWPYENKDTQEEEIGKGVQLLKWIYSESSFKNWVRDLGTALNLYVPADRFVASDYGREKLQKLMSTAKSYHSNSIALTEFGVKPVPYKKVDEYTIGRKLGELTVELLKNPTIKFATVYCLNEHNGFEFITSEGKRNVDRIRGYKELMGLR